MVSNPGRAIDEPCTLPLSPQKVAQNAILLFLTVKFKFRRKSLLQSFFVRKPPEAEL